MSALLEQLPDAWGRWAAAAAWQVALLATLIALVALMTRRLPARFRYALWLLVIVKVYLPPSLATQWGVGNWAIAPLWTEASKAAPVASGREAILTQSTGAGEIGAVLEPTAAIAPVSGSSVLAAAPSQPARPPSSAGRWFPASWTAAQSLFAIWAMGAATLLGFVLRRYWRLTRSLRGATEVGEGPLYDELTRLACGLRATAPPRLLLSSHVHSPFLFGVLRPRIVLPAMLPARLRPSALRMVLLHELLHWKRRDPVVGWLQVFAQALFWFHPFVWLANARLRRERESACDEAALAQGGCEPRAYGESLLDVLLASQGRSSAILGFLGIFERSTNVRQRLENIMRFRGGGRTWRMSGAIFVALFALVFLPMSAAREAGKLDRTETIQPGDYRPLAAAAMEVEPPGDTRMAPPGGTKGIPPEETLREIRRRLADLPAIEDDLQPELPRDLHERIVALRPASGDALLAIIADPGNELHRRATNAFLKTWESHSPEQIDTYFKRAMTAYVSARPQYPQGLRAYVGAGYWIRYGWGGWPKQVEMRTISRKRLDGRPYGKPFEYEGPMASSGGFLLRELDLGEHTAQAMTDYELTYQGRTYRGTVESEVVRFEIVPADSPNPLAAPPDPVLDDLVHRSFRFMSTHPDIMRFDTIQPDPNEPQMTTMRRGSPDEYALRMPLYELTEPLPVDLCFQVEIHIEQTGEVREGSPLFIPKGEKSSGYFAPEDAHGFVTIKEGTIPLTIVLKPSLEVALNRRGATQYYTGTLRSEPLEATTFWYLGAKATPWLKEIRAMAEDVRESPECDTSLRWVIEAMTSPNPYRRSNAAASLASNRRSRSRKGIELLIPLLIKTLEDPEQSLWSNPADNAVEALGNLGEIALRPLVEALEHPSADVRRRALAALINMATDKRRAVMKPITVAPIIRCLKDDDVRVRRVAASALCQLHDATALEPLLSALKDEDTELRANAAMALGWIADPRASDALIDALRDKEGYVRQGAAEALGKIGDPETVDSLIAILDDPVGSVRFQAAYSLGYLKDRIPPASGRRVVLALIKSLGDREPSVRQAAAYSLGGIKDHEAIEPLVTALGDDKSNVRRAAAKALEKITGEDFGEDRDGWTQWWEDKMRVPEF